MTRALLGRVGCVVLSAVVTLGVAIDGAGLALGDDGAPSGQGAIGALRGIGLPYTGQGAVWVVDDGWLIVQLGGAQAAKVQSNATPGQTGIGGRIGAGAVGPPKANGVSGAGSRAASSIGTRSAANVRRFAFRLPPEGLVLAGDGSSWCLQREQPSAEEQRTTKPQIVPVAPGSSSCGGRSVLDVAGALCIRANAGRGIQLDICDEKTGRRLVADLEPTTHAPSPGGEQAVATVSCTITCDNGTACSVSVTCGDPGCWVHCFCDTDGNATCIYGYEEAQLVDPQPVAIPQ